MLKEKVDIWQLPDAQDYGSDNYDTLNKKENNKGERGYAKDNVSETANVNDNGVEKTLSFMLIYNANGWFPDELGEKISN